MKKISNPVYYILLVLVIALFSSCEKDGVTSIIINKSTLSQNVGHIDTIVVTVKFTGDFSELPVSWAIADTNIVSKVTELKGAVTVSNSESSIEKMIVVKAKKSGATKVTLTAGDKSIDCDVTVIMRKFTFSDIIANNYGDSYDVETNNFEIVLYENTIDLNSDGKLVGDGNFLVLDFNVPLTQSSMVAGSFSPSDLEDNFGEVQTFTPGYYYQPNENYYFSLFINRKQNAVTISLISGGTYKITAIDNGFKIDGELLLEDGEVVQFEYSGPVNVADQRDAAEINPVLTHGLLHYWGDFYDTKVSNNLSVNLASASLNFTDTATNGDLLVLDINVPLTVTDTIPNGTYNFVNFPKEMTQLPLSDFIAGTLVPPFYDGENNEYGTWYYGEEKTKKPKTGSITVAKTGTKSYRIEYNFMDRFGAVVRGTFNGDLEYTDKTKTASGVKMAKAPAKTKNQTITPATKINEFAKKQKQRAFYY